MSDRRDTDAEELRALLSDLESTLVSLRGELDDDRRDVARIPRGLPGGGRPAPRPPRLREVLRFTEEYTIPTLISVLEANIRLLQLGGAALRALDPERSTVGDDTAGSGAVGRAIDAGRGLSTDRLRSSLDELNDALAGTDAADPEARELLSEAEALSAEIQDRLRTTSERADGARSGGTERADDAVQIDVADDRDGGTDDGDSQGDASEDSEASPEPDVDAELDSIREAVRGSDSEGETDEETDEDTADDDAEDRTDGA